MKTKSALSYFGSDSAVASELASHFDDCSHVTIPFLGGAAILPKLKAKAIVANDKNNLAINYYRVLSGRDGNSEKLFSLCENTLSHPYEIELSLDIIDEKDEKDPTMLAWAYWALCWVGRKGKGGTKNMAGPASVRRTAIGGNNASRIKAVAKDLKGWAQHFERCEWEQKCFRELIPQIADEKGCGIYLDPPWFGVSNKYFHSFEMADHEELRDLLTRFTKTKVLVRYDDHEVIRELYRGWEIERASTRNQANRAVKEIWIKNEQDEEKEDIYSLLNAENC